MPWIELVEVDFFDDGDGYGLRGTLGDEVVIHEFFIGGVESEARR